MEAKAELKKHVTRPVWAPASSEYTKLMHADASHSDYVVVNWCMGNLCNYSCSYCPEGLHNGSMPWPSLEDCIRFAEAVFKHHGKNKKYFFELTGGEITLFKQLPEFLNFLKDRGAKVGLISNGSRSLDFWKKIRPLIDQICLSYHPEQAKPEHYLSVVEFLSESVRTHVNIMMAPDHFETCRALAEGVIKIPNLSLALQPLLRDLAFEMFPYPEEQKALIDNQYDLFTKKIKFNRKFEYFRGAMVCEDEFGNQVKASPHKFISSGTNQWKGWDCFAGVEQVVVDMSGDLFRGWCLEGGSLGNIKDDQLRLPVDPVQCGKEACHCNFDIMCTKQKNSGGI